MALNQIFIHGRLTADSELKQTPSGVSVCTISVAVDRSYKSGEEKQTDFFTVVCWRGLADMVGKFFKKGKEILVSGNMQSRKWQDKEGNNRVSWELLAQNVYFCGNKGSGGNATAEQSSDVPASEFVEISPDDDSLPF